MALKSPVVLRRKNSLQILTYREPIYLGTWSVRIFICRLKEWMFGVLKLNPLTLCESDIFSYGLDRAERAVCWHTEDLIFQLSESLNTAGRGHLIKLSIQTRGLAS